MRTLGTLPLAMRCYRFCTGLPSGKIGKTRQAIFLLTQNVKACLTGKKTVERKRRVPPRCKSTPPRGGFPSSIARRPRGCQYRTIRLRKALGEMFRTPTGLASTCGESTMHRKSIQGCVICIVVYQVRYYRTSATESSSRNDKVGGWV